MGISWDQFLASSSCCPVLSPGVRADEMRPVLTKDRFTAIRPVCAALITSEPPHLVFALYLLEIVTSFHSVFLLVSTLMRQKVTLINVHHRTNILPFFFFSQDQFPALLSELPQGVISSFPPPFFPFCLLTINYNSYYCSPF